MPPTLSPTSSHSPVCTPLRTSRPRSRTVSAIAWAHVIARAGPSKVARKPSPACSGGLAAPPAAPAMRRAKYSLGPCSEGLERTIIGMRTLLSTSLTSESLIIRKNARAEPGLRLRRMCVRNQARNTSGISTSPVCFAEPAAANAPVSTRAARGLRSPRMRRTVWIAFLALLASACGFPLHGEQVSFSTIDAAPDWSPDGRLIAFASDRGLGGIGIYVIRPDGSGLRQLFRGVASDVEWAPDARPARWTVLVPGMGAGWTRARGREGKARLHNRCLHRERRRKRDPAAHVTALERGERTDLVAGRSQDRGSVRQRSNRRSEDRRRAPPPGHRRRELQSGLVAGRQADRLSLL